VTKKIVSALCKIKERKQKKLFLGNLNAKRDWGHARDYCVAMWKILQQKNPDDYVIATGVQYSIKQFINLTAKKLNMKLVWKGKGIKEKAYDESGKSIIECDKNYFRPLDVNTLLGDARKARKQLKWKPKENINSLIDEMIQSEYQLLDVQ
jgi:GDPmannose 4,6-dehydratase